MLLVSAAHPSHSWKKGSMDLGAAGRGQGGISAESGAGLRVAEEGSMDLGVGHRAGTTSDARTPREIWLGVMAWGRRGGGG